MKQKQYFCLNCLHHLGKFHVTRELVNAHYNSLTTHELCHQNIFLKHMTASQLNPSYECGEGMKVKVVKWCLKMWNWPILMHIYDKQCEMCHIHFSLDKLDLNSNFFRHRRMLSCDCLGWNITDISALLSPFCISACSVHTVYKQHIVQCIRVTGGRYLVAGICAFLTGDSHATRFWLTCPPVWDARWYTCNDTLQIEQQCTACIQFSWSYWSSFPVS